LKKILIADDHFEIRELLKDLLDGGSYQILFSENGKNAVETALREKPDLIVMDIMMPGRINGLEATEIIKSDPESKDSKIIILSAKGKDQDKINALKSGASAFIEKPFSPTKLRNKIIKLLES